MASGIDSSGQKTPICTPNMTIVRINSKYIENYMIFGLRACPKSKIWPKFEIYDGLSALKHALSCFSSSKTPIYIPSMPILFKISFFGIIVDFSHGRATDKWAWSILGGFPKV